MMSKLNIMINYILIKRAAYILAIQARSTGAVEYTDCISAEE